MEEGSGLDIPKKVEGGVCIQRHLSWSLHVKRTRARLSPLGLKHAMSQLLGTPGLEYFVPTHNKLYCSSLGLVSKDKYHVPDEQRGAWLLVYCSASALGLLHTVCSDTPLLLRASPTTVSLHPPACLSLSPL